VVKTGLPATLTSIELFLDTTTASQNVYENVCATFTRHMQRTNPGVEFELLSHYRVQGTIAELTGVYSMKHDMCPNTCIAYTGPFSDLSSCPKCEEPRYKITPAGRERQPQRQFHTIPLGPQLQALWRSPDSAKKMRHRSRETRRILEELERDGNRIKKWEDIYHGTAYLDAVRVGNIKDDDMVLLMSIDGAQLYQSKQSDCWIYIWVILDLAPDVRYKKGYVFPGGFIPGPNKPKHPDSYIFLGFHHVAALMKEGLGIWDAAEDITFISHPFLHLGTADGPGMTYLNGLTGHSGAFGCRLYCAVKGRRKEGGNHYYPALLKPNNYDVAGCNHDDVDGSHLPSANIVEYEAALRKVLLSRTTAQHEENRKDTGITKPSIFSGFPTKSTLDVPLCFGADLMHLISLNLTDLLISPTFCLAFGEGQYSVTRWIMMFGIGLSSPAILGRSMAVEWLNFVLFSLDHLIDHLVTLRKRFLVVTKPGNTSRIFSVLAQPCCKEYCQTSIGGTTASLFVVSDSSTSARSRKSS
jgi:hypothetical protein